MASSTNQQAVRVSIGRYVREWRTARVREVKEVALQALADAQTISPVDTGLFRASHALTMGQPAPKAGQPALSASDAEKGVPGPAALRQVQAGAARLERGPSGAAGKGVTIFLTNNLSYAADLEAGSSPQAKGPGAIYGRARQLALRRLSRLGLTIK